MPLAEGLRPVRVDFTRAKCSYDRDRYLGLLRDSARVGPANGSDAMLHGQGPRAEASAARGAPACEARECAPRDAVRFLTFRAGSAGGPKPGRASFCGELGGI